MIHAHMTAWFLALILFFVSIGLHKSGKEKGSKIVHMILRVVYLLILLTGFMLLFSINITIMYVLKAAVGLWVISMLEMISIRTKKNEKASILWIQFVVALLLVLYLGFSLPLGTDLF
ncbi:YisL family protein [Bacillus sp. JJ1609]|uniref:YisL family protein n=1 Tax=Bacillus sp. JJ1609 TaxID=3122977 RepID=UPI002FFEBF69